MAIFSRSLRLPTLTGLAFAVLLGQPAASGTVSKRLAVLELKGAKIEGEVLDAFADAVRGGAVEGLAGRGVQVMTRENMMVLLRSMGKNDCTEGDCEVETARNIGADFVVSGSVVRIDEAFVVTLKLHETRDGSLLATDQIDAKKQLEVLRQLREHSRAIVANNIWPRPAPPPVERPRSPEPTPAATSAAAASVPPPHPAPQSARGCAANQVPIPGGTFWMGDQEIAKPVHKVTLSPFCIDKTEVTVAAFRACVQAGDCPPPSATAHWESIDPIERTRWSQFCTWDKTGLDQHPINCVDWKQASAYCEWTGGRLPTEAEWEYAARGNDGRSYPWGNKAPDATRLNACGSECVSTMVRKRLDATRTPMYTGDDGWPATAPAGSYPKGASPFGVLDMAGNVWEWTADSFSSYSDEAVTNPQRSQDAASGVTRGGGWDSHVPSGVHAAARTWLPPAFRSGSLGFRCARGTKA
ncbi:MAG: SUMF1/EgtB/PvdO family nonheme iron enzyme [Polyangia bacterium]